MGYRLPVHHSPSPRTCSTMLKPSGLSVLKQATKPKKLSCGGCKDTSQHNLPGNPSTSPRVLEQERLQSSAHPHQLTCIVIFNYFVFTVNLIGTAKSSTYWASCTEASDNGINYGKSNSSSAVGNNDAQGLCSSQEFALLFWYRILHCFTWLFYWGAVSFQNTDQGFKQTPLIYEVFKRLKKIPCNMLKIIFYFFSLLEETLDSHCLNSHV